jgi:hypothetical protein
MTNPTPIAFRTRKPFAPPSQTSRAATLLDLLDREELLMEQARSIGEGSYRRRLEIEAELSEIRRDLKRLGFAAAK